MSPRLLQTVKLHRYLNTKKVIKRTINLAKHLKREFESMPERPEQLKIPRSVSPVARAGAGDISERELSRERHQLQSTPPARLQPVHPKKQLFFTPVNKFTAKWTSPSPNLTRIRSCLDEYKSQTPRVRPAKIEHKAASMEDLTPAKRVKKERKDRLPVLRSPAPDSVEERAAATVARFMLVAAWRRRRHEVHCLRKTLESQVSCSERLRMQVCALKSLLDSDNAKVRLAMKELERLKQLLRDKELEKALLEREKSALEDDVCAAEDRASEMSIGWRNCRNELEGVRASAAVYEHALANERAAHAETTTRVERAYARLSVLEEDLAQHDDLLCAAEAEAAALRREAEERQRQLEQASEQLLLEQEARSRCSEECAKLNSRVTLAAAETSSLRVQVEELQAQLGRMQAELRATRDQLDWWPRPLTRMLGAARSWLGYPKTMHEAILWTLIPARHGC